MYGIFVLVHSVLGFFLLCILFTLDCEATLLIYLLFTFYLFIFYVFIYLFILILVLFIFHLSNLIWNKFHFIILQTEWYHRLFYTTDCFLERLCG